MFKGCLEILYTDKRLFTKEDIYQYTIFGENPCQFSIVQKHYMYI